MIKFPNEAVLRDLVQKIDTEYDLQNRLNRYKTLSPELVTFALEEGLKDDEALQALFVTDFIVTASEIPRGSSDEDRYKSVFQSFILGRSRNLSADSLMRIFYFAYKTASKIRSQDLFMGGRGLNRKASLLRLKDSYITPYLSITSEILGKGSCDWELGLLFAALKRTNPNIEIQNLRDIPVFNEFRALTKIIWNLLIEYSQVQSVQTNENVVIENLNSSKALLLPDIRDSAHVSLWNHELPFKLDILKSEMKSFTDSLRKGIMDSEVALIKGRIAQSNEYFFIVRDPLTKSKPILLIQTNADDINFSKALTILQLRGKEENGWKDVFSEQTQVIIQEKEKTLLDPGTVQPFSEPIEEETRLKVGFLTKIKQSIFGKRKKAQEKKTFTSTQAQKMKKKSAKQKINILSEGGFIAQSIIVDSLSKVDTFELFDSFRDDNYHIIGVFDSYFKNNQTKFSIHPGMLSHSIITSFLKDSFKASNNIYNSIFNVPEIYFEEVFTITEHNQKYLISLNRSDERAVGIIATSIPGEIKDWESRGKETESLLRQSLHRRTNQFLTIRRHTHFSEAVERIFGENFDIKTAEEHVLEDTIFSLS